MVADSCHGNPYGTLTLVEERQQTLLSTCYCCCSNFLSMIDFRGIFFVLFVQWSRHPPRALRARFGRVDRFIASPDAPCRLQKDLSARGHLSVFSVGIIARRDTGPKGWRRRCACLLSMHNAFDHPHASEHLFDPID
jgi:hypothetical protein